MLFDPLAQNFFIDASIYPNGLFLTSIKVCFSTKDAVLPVSIQIRPTINGYPSSNLMVPFSEVTLAASQIIATTSPNLDSSTSYTEFVFPSPIFLLAGSEYSFILQSNSNNYNIYTALVGEKVLGSNRLISSPPYIGSLFKSQNSSTWTPVQGESIMFRLSKAVFTPNSTGIVYLNSTANTTNTIMDTMYVGTSDQKLDFTSIDYAFSVTSNADGSISSYVNYIPNSNYSFNERKVITTANGSMKLKSTLSTTHRDISPIIDLERMNLVSIENKIDDGSLSNSNIIITNPGQGYNVLNTNTITVSGGGGSGAVLALGNTDPITGNITQVYVVSGGRGYISTPNVTINTTGYTPTYNVYANGISILGETSSHGGPAEVRYITRKITLADGMDSGDIKIFVDVHRPVGTDVKVYAKILSSEDYTPFEDRTYIPLTQVSGNNTFSTSNDDFTEFSYQLDTSGTTTKKNLYGTFSSFKYFSIKIILLSNNPSVIPRIRKLRAIALPTL